MGDLVEDHVFAAKLLGAMRQPVLLLDGALCVRTANSTFLRTFGLALRDVAGTPLGGIGRGLLAAPRLQFLLQSLAGQGRELAGLELTLPVPGGSPRTFLVDGRSVDGFGDRHVALLAFEDVTERRRTEASMRESEERFRSAFDFAAIGMALVVTGFSERCHEEEARAAGISGYLTKPVRDDELRACLERVLRHEEAADRSGGAAAETGAGTAGAAPRATVRILVAEDNVVNQKVALLTLQRLGYDVHVVANGLEALRALEREPFDLILMDCQMPEMDGFEATTEIRRREGPTRHHPIIAMTASAMQGDRERCFVVGMDDYIAKPVQPEALDRILQRWLGTAELERGPRGPLPAVASPPEPARAAG